MSKSIVFLTKPSATLSEIAKALEVPYFLHARNLPRSIDLLVRWGNVEPLGRHTEVGLELNSRQAIIDASNKPRARKLLTAAHIPVPIEGADLFPCIGRPTHHTSGRKFFVCNSENEVRRARRHGATYFSQVYPKKQEYRIHIGSGRTILVSEKKGNPDNIIWNRAMSGFTFRHLARYEWREDQYLRAMIHTSKYALDVLGLDFGTLDIMVNRDYEVPFVVSEVNTAPALSPLGMVHYMEYFINENI